MGDGVIQIEAGEHQEHSLGDGEQEVDLPQNGGGIADSRL